ncbi:peroxidase family protein [Pseudobacteriovorax antillogorgiicola]|uniref:Animal haem peroxidase n=1 Tax=Pseudobacteriovorax antillogorgiicola TaxID=1513793 RepID=A0A1Y6C3P1_9BACT|nr:peroxidase family protein [Pseudobacteriovorax antillogorgiicola]TCS49849.1 heme peroxidase [Pseudobacteriovorax antillogorgiicola]SMF43697.1 Animal haem peroxidase [Pseudobacteriovorax antillogorgiicola]
MKTLSAIALSISASALGDIRLPGDNNFLPPFNFPSVPGEFRSIDGYGNNRNNPFFGSAGNEGQETLLLKSFFSLRASQDNDDFSDLRSPRDISNIVARQATAQGREQVSDLFWLWGQFLDHDITLVPQDPTQSMPIEVPRGDSFFDPKNRGGVTISFNRSAIVRDQGGKRQFNRLTAFIDGSQVYGSDSERAELLRDQNDSARLAVSANDLLPIIDGIENDDGGSGRPGFYAAGDVRANEHIGLSAMHNIFVREHNNVVEVIRGFHPQLADDDVYEFARLIVGGIVQKITYDEFLPLLLGRPLFPYQGYNSNINPNIEDVFASAAFRFGHSMLSSDLKVANIVNGQLRTQDLKLRNAFFNPTLYRELGPEKILLGFSMNRSQKIDTAIVEDVRSFLFGPPPSAGSDLAALNIQRGRDHLLPTYNEMRQELGYNKKSRFLKRHSRDQQGITSNSEIAANLEEAYGHPDRVELWVGGLSEDKLGGSRLGETFTSILTDQFIRLRDGDRFWYENVFKDGFWREYIERSTLADVLQRNSDLGNYFDNTVFFADR